MGKAICNNCGASFARKDIMTRHKMNSCRSIDGLKSKETFVLEEPLKKVARMDTSSSEPTNLNVILKDCLKPKSLDELWLKRNQDDDDDDDDDDEDDDEENDDDDEDDDEENDENQDGESVNHLPTTRIELESRFNKLFCEFTRQKKLENRNELVFLLDEMLRHEYITPVDYESFNNILADSLPLSADVESRAGNQEEKDIRNLIHSTTKTLIRNDEEEVKKLIKEFKAEADEEMELEEMEKSVEKFLDGELTLSSILDISRKLENSSLLLSKQLRLRMLLNDIADNRHRVQTILTRLKDNGRDENTLKQLVREQLLSPEQYEKLNAAAALDLTAIAEIIKDTKVGRGLKFLPRTVDDLKTKVQVLLKEIATKGIDAIKNELIAVLDKLLHKNGITENVYSSINNDIKKGEGLGYYGYLL